MSPRALWWVLKQAFVGWWNHNVPRFGASLVCYMLFALSPMLVIAISVAGLVFSGEVVQGEIVGQMQGLVRQKGAAVVQVILEGASQPSTSILATAIGAVMAFFGATGAFIEMQTAFNAIWRVTPRPSVGMKELLLQRLISFGLVIGMGSITLVSLGIITLLRPMVYNVLPDVRLHWHDVWVGALVTAGSAVVLLIWVYYSAQVVLIGGEFTRFYVERFRGEPPPMRYAGREPAPPQLPPAVTGSPVP